MTGLKLQERTTIEAVARRFSATWEKRSDPPRRLYHGRWETDCC